MTNIILKLIKLYQKTISPDHGLLALSRPFQGCRYFPSCSQYCYEAVNRHGFSQGLFLGLKRFLRCHPWSVGGYDPVP